jgi:NADH:ubiquinone oxidoreductase subunit K
LQENDSSKKKIKDMSNIPLIAYLALSTIMFFAGVYGFLSRRNMLTILMSLELMLNAADINFAAFNRYLFPGQLDGMFFSIFAIGVSAAETAIAIAIIINIYRNLKNINSEEVNKMKF